tara:strand:+ start:5373 stop:5837 length:465 start_codon:yes stop_codon:yes gene_type:complete
MKYHIHTIQREQGIEYLDGNIHDGLDWDVTEITSTYEEAVSFINEDNEKSPLVFAAIWEWDEDAVVHTFPNGTKDLGQYTDNYEIIIWADPKVYEDLVRFFIEQEINWHTKDDVLKTIYDFQLNDASLSKLILNNDALLETLVHYIKQAESEEE